MLTVPRISEPLRNVTSKSPTTSSASTDATRVVLNGSRKEAPLVGEVIATRGAKPDTVRTDTSEVVDANVSVRTA